MKSGLLSRNTDDMTMQFPPDFLETLRQPVLCEAELGTQSSFFSREEVRGFYLSVTKSPEKNEVLQLAVDQLPLLHPHRAALLALFCGALVEDGADPHLLFGAALELMSDLLASLEYGVQFLGTPFILVLGHSGCGAVDAAIKVLKTKATLPGHLPELITAIKPAVVIADKTASGNLLDNAIAENVRRQVARLKESPPIVQKAYRDKKIDIKGGVYDIASGKVTLV